LTEGRLSVFSEVLPEVWRVPKNGALPRPAAEVHSCGSMWLSRKPTAGNKKPTAVGWRWVFEEDFSGNQILSPPPGICPNDKSKGHRANARVLSFVGAGEKVIHCRQRRM
jgi:hypothetical protein